MHTQEQVQRSERAIVRTHRRFLLRSLDFAQQYAPMYRCRLETQHSGTLAAIQRTVTMGMAEEAVENISTQRVLELVVGRPSVCVGVVYKQMRLLPKFLEEYQKELVRIDAGDDDNDEDDGMAEMVADEAPRQPVEGTEGEEGEAQGGLSLAAANEHYSICTAGDELLIEDSSGRVLLQGLDPERFCTGLVLGVYGTLLPNGHLQVIRYSFCGLEGLTVPRPLLSTPAGKGGAATSCYIAFVCGLGVRAMPPEDADATRARTLLELLIDFISGNVGDEEMLTRSRCISRLVIGGNSIATTEELKLKKKVKLDPSDHVRLNDDKAQSGVVTSAQLMRELDAVLVRLATSVEVELMPGDNDVSDAFQPQQPLHPVILPTAARYSSLRLVSNPYEFVVLEDGIPAPSPPSKVTTSTAAVGDIPPPAGVSVFVTSGQNVNDVARETRFPNRLDTMAMILQSGCACPTAPNTLFSYPFRDTDPFLFTRAPHCFVACDQPRFESRYVSYEQLEVEAGAYLASSALAADTARGATKTEVMVGDDGAARNGARLVCVPSFERTGTIVLVDVNSPTLRITTVNLSMS